MKFIISESRIEKIAIQWLDDNYGDLDVIDIRQYPEDIQYEKNGEMIFNFNIRTHNVYINNSFIWSDLKHYFNMSYEQIQVLTKKWVEDRFGIPVSTTLTYPDYH
jgi:predicted 3-demethylubiquinone-9 3-methyltransferase (glyoxalase superfamily)